MSDLALRADPLERRSPAIERELRGAAIGAVGAALPERVVTNEEVGAVLGVDDHWIQKRIGVVDRRWLGDGETLVDLAAEAGRSALDEAGLEAGDVDLILVASTTQDRVHPSAAPMVAHALGVSEVGAIDVGSACLGFVSALSLGAGMVESCRADRVLVIGADQMSRFIDKTEQRTGAMFGDGAGAVVLAPTDAPGRIGPVVERVDGRFGDTVYTERSDQQLRMEGHDTFRSAVTFLSDITTRAIEAAGLTSDDIDLYAYHQANARILRAVGERLKLPGERVVNAIAHTGNTSAASIPLALAEAQRDDRLHDGARVLFAAIGAGFTWGAIVVQWGLDGRT